MPPLIEFDKISFTINKQPIIRNFSAKIYPGDFVILLGGNGSGKSTLLKLLNRTYAHSQGDITLSGKPIAYYDAVLLRRKLITLTQFTTESLFADLTLEENALLIESALYPDSFSSKRFLAELPAYLSSFHETLPTAIKTRIKNLSGGEQQMVAIALYLRHQPDVLLLDEHTSALDPKKSDFVMAFTQKIVTEKRITCLMTTHALHHALQYGNRLIAIREGRSIFDADAEKKAALSMADLLVYCY